MRSAAPSASMPLFPIAAPAACLARPLRFSALPLRSSLSDITFLLRAAPEAGVRLKEIGPQSGVATPGRSEPDAPAADRDLLMLPVVELELHRDDAGPQRHHRARGLLLPGAEPRHVQPKDVDLDLLPYFEEWHAPTLL